MSQDPIFTSADVAVLRAAARPRRPAPPLGRDGQAEEAWLRERFDALAADEQLLEAVEGASPSLSRDVRKIADGVPVTAKVLRRSALALTKYHLRMTGRATPFGFFAGIAPARIGEAPALRTGVAHRPVSRPDAAWLDAVLDRVRTDPAVLSAAVVVRNPVRTVRDGRLLLPERFDGAGTRRLETSIRFTPLVRAVVLAAARPIGWGVLVDHLRRRFGAGRDELEAVLRQLVDIGVLLTDLDPPPDSTDPLGHVLAVRAGHGHPLFAELRGIHRDLQAADAAAPGERRRRMRALARRMRALHDTTDIVQTDLRLDLDATLPVEVAREAERAASVLWRLTGAVGASWLPGYHERFVERYGTDRAVPVIELLDDTTGLGLPPWHHVGQTRTGDRETLLGELLLAAVRERRTEIVLDDSLVGLLTAGVPPRRRPSSMELCAELLAESWEALTDGDFRLVVGQSLGSALAGSTVARFAHVLPELDGDLTRLVTDGAPGDGVRAAQVACRPRTRRSANVSSVPQRLPLRIPIGCGPAAAPVTDIQLDRLAVIATRERLHVVDVATGVRIAPVSGSMLNPRSGHIPPVARFLLELGEQDTPQAGPWSWGALAAAPFLPRVRYGRTVLSPVRWLPSREMLDPKMPEDVWRRHVDVWRARWDVPREVRLIAADNHIPVDLDDPLHVMVLRTELRRHPQLLVQEVSAGQDDGGWLRSPGGPHTCEVVFQLLGAPAGRTDSVPPEPAPQRPSDLLQMPGGEWLYAKLYAGESAQEAIVRTRLTELVDEVALTECGVDGWFFLRYADPEPHLRLRFHGKVDSLWTTLLPRLHGWATRLRQDGLLARCVLDSYDPEVERYGGPDAMAAAERVFEADSRLALAARPEGDLELVAASGVLDLLLGFGTDVDALTWLDAAIPVAERRAVPMARREALATLLSEGAPGDPLRAEAIAAYAAKLDSIGCSPARRQQIAASLAHLHCNRLFGPDQARERAVLALLHGGLALRADRARFGR